MADKQKVLAGRKAVDAYRIAHTKLYYKPQPANIPEAHTPLLNRMLDALRRLGFNSLDEFFNASDSLQDGWE